MRSLVGKVRFGLLRQLVLRVVLLRLVESILDNLQEAVVARVNRILGKLIRLFEFFGWLNCNRTHANVIIKLSLNYRNYSQIVSHYVARMNSLAFTFSLISIVDLRVLSW